jgi:NitT/TauT family transport system permease protein
MLRTAAVDNSTTATELTPKFQSERNIFWPARRAFGYLRVAIIPLVSFLVVLGIWEAVVQLASIKEYILPSPSEVAQKMVSDRGLLFSQSIPTAEAILLGFALAIAISVPLAVAMVYFPAFNRAIYPILVASQVVPKIALAPLFVVWVGFGAPSKVAMAFLISFFPVLIDTLGGLSSVRTTSIMLLRSMGARRWDEFWRLRLPHSLPQMFAGLKVGVTFAVVGEIVGEFVGSDNGLGFLITQARGELDTVTIFAAIACLTIIGGLLFLLIEVAEAWLLRNRPSSHVGAVPRATT